ncbi:MAG: Lrp/AsnC ligand binding domain-containing protein [Acidilobaceae archaeon]|nr:Lrp/AsnC ligand binding domain-containing protein [Acidilobaceae archaeon]MCX8165002.1 Lrp/AsnC ligand binding domain-containing protein [Acidilobaceae archaeon]MDW7974481.1 Lrp/AsnC ligand binding domain-containing protein [Sulfolobales archaeon]
MSKLSEAIVMINVETGKEDEIFNKLMELPEVQEIYMIYGVHDIMAVLRSSDMDSMRNVITQKIRKMNGVKSTITSIVIKKQVKGQQA